MLQLRMKRSRPRVRASSPGPEIIHYNALHARPAPGIDVSASLCTDMPMSAGSRRIAVSGGPCHGHRA